MTNFSIERAYRGEDSVFFTQVPRPETLSLEELDAIVRYHKSAPVEEVPNFTRAMFLTRSIRPASTICLATAR